MNKSLKFKERWGKVLGVLNWVFFPIFSLALVIASFLFLSYSHTTNRLYSSFSNKYVLGDLVDDNIVSPTNLTFIDESATKKDTDEALLNSYPVYTVSLSDTLDNYNIINSILEDDKEQTVLLREALFRLINDGIFEKKDLDNTIAQNYKEISVLNDIDGIHSTKVQKVSEVVKKESLENAVYEELKNNESNINPSYVNAVLSFILPKLKANVHYDRMMTSLERDAIISSIKPTVRTVKQGDILVKKDSVVTEETFSLLKSISTNASVYNLTKRGTLVVFFVALFLGFYVLFLYILKGNRRKAFYLNVIYFSSSVFVAIVSFSYPYLSGFLHNISYDLLIPQFLVPLIILSISGSKALALSSVLFLSSILGFLPFSGIYAVARYFFSGFLSVEFLHYTTRRIDYLINYVMVFLMEIFITAVSTTLEGIDFSSMFVGVLISCVVFIVGQALAMGCSILLEKIFNLPTPYRLNELINKKTALLDKFEKACPGSYDHALTVEKLATAASDELGLNTPLVRLASMYHDVGKTEHPLYFIENQSDENKHDALSLELSTTTIRSHVALGVKLAKSAHLPEEVIDIIGEHHGNDTINYFYYEAQKQMEEQGGQKEDVSESDFAYNALPPQTKEAAVVMLSDISEAAVRSIKKSYQKRGEDINEDAVRKIIHKLFLAKLEKKQLSDSSLTIGELLRIENLFVQKLVSENHSRIEYKNPNEKEKVESD